MKSFSESASNNKIISIDKEISKLNNEELDLLYDSYKSTKDKDTLSDMYFILDDLIEDDNHLNLVYSHLKNI